MNDPLLPCRFCQESFQLQVVTVDLKNHDRDLVKCRKCRGQAPREYWNLPLQKASMKFPDMKPMPTNRRNRGVIKGFNAAIQACKELNAPKAEAECDGSFCRYCGPMNCICDGYGNEQPSEKKESEVEELAIELWSVMDPLGITKWNTLSKDNQDFYKARASHLINAGWSKKEGKDG